MTAYINLTRNEYPRHEGDIEIYPNDTYANVEWVDRPVYDYKMQRCGEGWPVEIDGVWHMTWVVRDATQAEIDEMNKPFDPFNLLKVFNE
jgi:hypothetical protein